ncbi:MAG TPA: APC family permease [Candidatus Eremiobacteraceae bacterium]|nr:APC family permease [Candidatus Eremiobacteraceae bacterium]
MTKAPPTELRRSVTTWGSYAWGYADVGADIYVALGVVIGIAAGAANVAFAFAGLVYVCIGLAYTELSSAYPVAGGGQFFAMRALGDFIGFVAGWAVLLDFTIDIALFAWFTIGYISFLIPWLGDHKPVYFACVLLVTAFLTVLNSMGVKQSSRLNELVSALDVVTETVILVCAFLLAWDPKILVHTMQTAWPSTDDLLKGISLAIISFVGLESISHAAEETRRPTTVIPRTSVALILTILIFALAYSNLVLGMHPVHTAHGGLVPMYQYIGSGDNNDKAIAVLASQIPYLGFIFALYVPLVGALLVLISSNSGVFGASRIAYSMAKFNVLPSWFQVTNPKTRTPIGTIVVFSGIAAIELCAAYLQGPHAIGFLADLYAFGAALSYTLVFIALITLRFSDSIAPRRFKMPWNIPMTVFGKKGDVSILAVIGTLGIFAILIFTLLTHPIGRIAGPMWVLFGIAFYAVYRRGKHLPVFGSVKRNWVKLHEATLVAAGEIEMLDEYDVAVKAQNKAQAGG